MQMETMKIANAIAGVALLALLAAALVVGQAKANFDSVATLVPDAAERQERALVLTKQSMKKIESIPRVVDAMLALPLIIEVGVDSLTVRPLKYNKK